MRYWVVDVMMMMMMIRNVICFVFEFLVELVCRMWEFSVALYMINIWPDSLLLTALYGVIESASVALFGPVVGQWVNKLTYAKVR